MKLNRLITYLWVFAVATTVLFVAAGCNSQDELDSIEEIFYSSKVYSFDFKTDNYYIYKQGNNIVAILCSSDGDNTDYYRYTINQAGELSNGTLLDVDAACSFCGVGENNTACYLSHRGVVVLDESGKVINEENDVEYYSDSICDVESSVDGFVVINREKAVLYSLNGDRLGLVNLNDIGSPSEEVSYFERNGERYISLETSNATTAYYVLDFSEGSYSFVGDNETLGLEDDFTVYRYGGYSYDEYNGLLSKIDFENNKLVPLALIENFVYQPPVYVITSNIHFHIIDDNTYAYVYRYDVNKTEIVVLSRDTDNNFSNRTKLSIQGSNIKEDNNLMWAVYKYNTIQDVYLMVVSDFGDKYRYSTAAEAQEAKLALISTFQNGNSPDLFYGKDFDYEQWGRSGMVLDIYPYLSENAISSLTDSIKSIMIGNDHCYSVFSGYTMFGFIGKSSQYSDRDYCIDSLPSLYEGQQRICKMHSVDIADFILRYHIMQLNGKPYDLDSSQIRKAVQIAIENGAGPTEAIDSNDGFRSGSDSMSLRIINNDIKNYLLESRYLDDEISFIGFPSVYDTAYAIYPFGYVSVSSGTDYPEACVDFINILLSVESQRLNYVSGTIPVNEEVLDEYLNYMVSPETIPEDMITYKYLPIITEGMVDQSGHLHRESTNIEVSPEEAQSFKDMITSVNTVITYDWGIYNIICEEINSYYISGRSIDDITNSLDSRLRLYYGENYG